MAITINNEPDSSGYQSTPSETSSGILNTTGQSSGSSFLGNLSLNSIFGFNRSNSFYTDFYRNLLTTANCPPINALWMVFIQDIPSTDSIIEGPTGYNDKDGADFSSKNFSKAASEGRRTRGVLLAQGVKHTGDGSNFSREGYKNTGLWKGVLSNGRSDIQTLDVSFLESNVSFVDYALRPWAVAIAHNGLTKPELYANNITVWHLSKMGAKTNFGKRKVIKYHNCFPINIDQQEYNYTGDDVNVKRVVSFGYHYYTLEDADESVLDLLSYTSAEQGITDKLKGYLKTQADNAVDSLKSSLGANSVSQYLNNIVERGKTFANSVITNTVQGAVTNVGGTVQDAVDGVIRDFTTEGRAAGNNLVTDVAEKTKDAVDSIVRNNPNADSAGSGVSINSGETSADDNIQRTIEDANYERLTEYGYVEKYVNGSDSTRHIVPKIESDEGASSVVDVNKVVNPNDTPDSVVSDVTQNEDGGISIARVKASGNPNDDTTNFLSSPSTDLLYYTEKQVSSGDTPSFATGQPDSNPNSGFRNGVDKTNLSTYSEVVIPASNDDSNPSDSINPIIVNVARDDSSPSQSVDFVQKRVPTNDAL